MKSKQVSDAGPAGLTFEGDAGWIHEFGDRGSISEGVNWRLRYEGQFGDISSHTVTFGIGVSR